MSLEWTQRIVMLVLFTMIPCSGCQRHIRADEARCPFCATALHVEPPPSPLLAHVGALLAGLALVGTTACAPDTTSVDGSTSQSSTTETTSDPTGETSTSAGEEAETDDPPDTAGSFYAPPESDFNPTPGCDPWMQDCPEGEKCVAYSSTNTDIPDANECVPVIGDLQPGEPCTFQGWQIASDDCGVDSFCAPTGEGPESGVCAPFCTGSPDDPICEDGSSCVYAYESSLNLCMPDCDPLLQDCEDAEICVWNTSDAFVCMAPLVEPQAVGEPCGIFNDCTAGSGCVDAELVVDCEGAACCTSYCDLAVVDICGPGLECVAFLDPDDPEPQPPFDSLGVCLAPEDPMP